MKSLVALALVVFGMLAPAPGFAAETAKPAAPAVPAVKPKPKAKIPDPVVGLLFNRKAGGYANLRVENNNFVLSFYDAKQEETKPDVSRAIVRFRRFGRDQRFMLTGAAGGPNLTSTIFVERPYRFTVTVLLFKDGVEEPDETFTQLYYQPMPGDGAGVSADAMTPEQAQKVQK